MFVSLFRSTATMITSSITDSQGLSVPSKVSTVMKVCIWSTAQIEVSRCARYNHGEMHLFGEGQELSKHSWQMIG